MSDARHNPYLRDSVLTAPPEQLQMMLYDGAIRFAGQGRDAIRSGDHEKSYDALTRAQKIMLELIHGLREEVDPPLVRQVSAIYMFIYRKLVEANVNKDLGAVDDALKILHYQRETWSLLLEKLRTEQAGSMAPPPAPASPEAPPPGSDASASGRRTVRVPPPGSAEYQPLSVEG